MKAPTKKVPENPRLTEQIMDSGIPREEKMPFRPNMRAAYSSEKVVLATLSP